MSLRKILYVFDEKAQVSKVPHSKDSEIILCPVTTDEIFIASTRQFFESHSILTKTFPYLESFHKKAFTVRKEYIAFIGHFHQTQIFKQRLYEYFTLNKTVSLWWTSLISEKNTLKSNSYHNMVGLLTVLDFVREYPSDEIYIDLNNRKLLEAIAQNIENVKFVSPLPFDIPSNLYWCGHFLKGLWRWLILVRKFFLARIKQSKVSNKLEKGKFFLLTYFSRVGENDLKNNQYTNKQFGSLQKALEEKFADKIVWLALAVNQGNFGYQKALQVAGRINAWTPIVFLEEFLSIRVLVRILKDYVKFSLKFLRASSSLKEKFCFPSGVKIWSIFRRDWYSSFCGTRLLEGIQYAAIFESLAKELPRDAIVSYIAESQGWERALNANFSMRSDVATIALQHSIVSLLMLNYFNDPYELKSTKPLECIPQPSLWATVGDIPLSLLHESGYRDRQTFVLGAIRFEHFKSMLASRIAWTDKKDQVVVALSFSVSESREVLIYIHNAYQNLKGIKVLIKAHPFCPVEPILKEINRNFSPDIFEFVDEPLPTLLKAAKAVIVTQSSAALEGLVAQSWVIIPRLISIIDMNPLSGLCDLPSYSNSPQELLSKTYELIAKPVSDDQYKRYKNFIESYCEFSETPKQVLYRLNEALQRIGK